MPIIKSAKKRVRTAKKATIRNNKARRGLKNAMNIFGKKPSASSHSAAQSKLDKAVKKGIIHKNKAARLKKQAAAKAKAAGVKFTATKKVAVVKKTVAKKPAVKKTAKKK